MHKLELLTQELLAAFHHETKQFYVLDWKISDHPERGFSSHLSRNMQINIRGSHLIDVAQAISQVTVACKSGFLKEFLGERYSEFLLKALWVSCNQRVPVSSRLSVFLPDFLDPSKKGNVDLFCRRMIELGYNTAVFGAMDEPNLPKKEGEMAQLIELCKVLRSYGIKIAIKPTMALETLTKSILDTKYEETVKEELNLLFSSLKDMDYLFWEGNHICDASVFHKKALDASLRELVTLNIHAIEQLIPTNISLIYFLPAKEHKTAHQQASWILSLATEVSDQTIIAFSAVAGDYFWDHLPPHPLWEKLRKVPRKTSISLLPILNAGMILQGEGLWPAPAIDLIERYLSRVTRDNFVGAIAVSPTIPASGSFLDSTLWVTAQSLQHPLSPTLLYEMWFKAHNPYWEYWKLEEILKKARRLVLDLSTLRAFMRGDKAITFSSDEGKVIADSLFSQIKELQTLVNKAAKGNMRREGKVSFTDYFPYFIRDAQRLIGLFLKNFNHSIPFGFRDEEVAESFWMSQNGEMFHQPYAGTAGSRMEGIFKENRLF